MSVLLKFIYRLNVIIKIPGGFFFVAFENLMLKTDMKMQRNPSRQNSFLEKAMLEDLLCWISKCTIKLKQSRSVVLAQKWNIDQGNKIENLSINLNIYGQLIFNKGARLCNAVGYSLQQMSWKKKNKKKKYTYILHTQSQKKICVDPYHTIPSYHNQKLTQNGPETQVRACQPQHH